MSKLQGHNVKINLWPAVTSVVEIGHQIFRIGSGRHTECKVTLILYVTLMIQLNIYVCVTTVTQQ